MRQVTSNHHLFRQGGTLALLLVSTLPLAAQTPPASPLKSSKISAPQKHSLPQKPTLLSTIEREIAQVEARMKARVATNAPAPAPGKKNFDPDRKRLNALRAYLYMMRRMANERGEVDWAAIERARAQRDRMPVGRIEKPKQQGGNFSVMAFPGDNLVIDPIPGNDGRWKFVGPTNLLSATVSGFGPQQASGRINCVAFDPNRSGTYYIAAPLGGAWKTTNRGATWTPLLDAQSTIAATTVVVDPTNSNVVYVGTGDYSSFAGPGMGLLKSTDSGATWTRLGAAQFGVRPIRKVLIDPANPLNLLVTAGGEDLSDDTGFLLRSTNGGQTFTEVLTGGPVENVVYNSNRTAVYAAVDTQGVFKSTDNGQTWAHVLDLQNAFGVDFRRRVDVAASPVNPDVVYTLSGGNGTAYKSTDGGASWEIITNNIPRSEFAFPWYDFYIACSQAGRGATARDMVWVGLLDVSLSKDGGSTWQPMANVYTESALTHTDQHSIAFNPKNNNEILVGNDGGVYYVIFGPDDDFISFQSLNARLGVTQFYGLDIHPDTDNYLIGGTQDNATPRANNQIFNWQNIAGGDGGNAFVNPNTPANQYATSQSYLDINGEDWLSMWRTDNNWGASISIDTDTIDSNFPPEFITPEAMDRIRPQFLFAGGFNVVRYDGTTSPGTWTQTDDDINAPVFTDGGSPAFPDYDPVENISAMGVGRGVDPTDPKIVLAGTLDGGVFFSFEDGANFHRIDVRHGRIPPPFGEMPDGTPVITPVLPKRTITSIQNSIFSLGRVFITMGGTGGGHVFRCNNVFSTAPTWTNISGNLPDVPVYSLAILPYEQGRRMYVGTEIGVFYTQDNGATWTNVTAPLGLPNVKVTRLEFNPTTGTLTAATYGRGMWQLRAGDNVLLQLNCVLQYYVGNKSRLGYRAEIFIPGQDLPQFPPIEIKTGALTVAGYIVSNVSARGIFDVYVKVPRYLRKRVPNVSITSNRPVSTGTMFCGDVNGDNAINNADLLAVQQRLGQFTTSAADLNGDGRVTNSDLSIVQRNLGRVGD